MRVLTLFCLTALGCAGNRRPVSKRLTVVQQDVQPNNAQEKPDVIAPWHHRQARWDGPALSSAPIIKWSVPTSGPVVHPVRTDGSSVFVVAGGAVTAVTLSGEILWTVNIGADGPVGFGDTGLFVPTKSGVMQVLDPTNGSLRESHGGSHPIVTAPLPIGHATVWLTSEGTLTTTSGPFDTIIEGPASDAATQGDLLIAGNGAGDVVATTTMTVRWRAEMPGPVVGHPVLGGDRAYIPFAASDGTHGGITALDLNTGTTIWVSRMRAQPSAPPAIGTHLIVPDTQSELVALDLDHGGIRWRSPAPSSFSSQPAVQADAIYVGRHDGQLDRIDMADGGTVWSLDLGGALTGAMCHTSGLIFLGTADGRLLALEAE